MNLAAREASLARIRASGCACQCCLLSVPEADLKGGAAGSITGIGEWLLSKSRPVPALPAARNCDSFGLEERLDALDRRFIDEHAVAIRFEVHLVEVHLVELHLRPDALELLLEHFGIGELLWRARGDVDRGVEVLVVTGRGLTAKRREGPRPLQREARP
jgi:hypothetical protein